MSSTAPHRPIFKGKRRLLEGCALAAGLMALAQGGPSLAQGVAGTGNVVSGSATISPPAAGTGGPNTTQVTTTTQQTVINWTPSDSNTNPAAGAIDFLPAANSLEFYGTGQYTVLNRFVGPAAAVRPVGLNGAITSFDGSPFTPSSNVQGGNIWFYNAGGLLIGANAVINVGSLVLTASDIDTSGGLFGAGGDIRFRGAAGSLASVEIAAGAAITAADPANAGGSYVAVVAPRIIQAGRVSTDGSTAYVAAEQTDIRINNGLFDINVLVGAEGGNVITHSGTTTGPAHQDGDIDQSRIYMVAIPKNDAVTMLVSGEIGYQDALVAQADPDGAVRLSAGFNIVNGEIDTVAASSTASHITINDTLFDSSVAARASGNLIAQPLSTLAAAPPAHLGAIAVKGDALLVGDASASVTLGAGQAIGATGNLTIQSGGDVAVNVSGGLLSAAGVLTIHSLAPQQTDGSSLGGDASLTVTGGSVSAAEVIVASDAVGGLGDAGDGGDGRGGAATILVSGAGSSLDAANVTARSSGFGGGVTEGPSGPVAADNGGSGFGGLASVRVENGGLMAVAQSLSVTSVGHGEVGVVQSGNGTGGIARVALSGPGSAIDAVSTFISAAGIGGGSDAQASMPIDSLNGGEGRGGTAELDLAGDATSIAQFGDTRIAADGLGGSAIGANAAGGNGRGGIARVTATGAIAAQFDPLALTATGESGGALGAISTQGRSGDGTGGTSEAIAQNGAQISSGTSMLLDSSGFAGPADNVGSGTGGTIVVRAANSGEVRAVDELTAVAFGGNSSAIAIAETAGDGTGGTIGFLADGGTIGAGSYSALANGQTVDVTGAGGTATGGSVDFLASLGGRIEATNSGFFTFVTADAQSGISAAGNDATGGTIRMIADAGTIALDGASFLSAGGVSGGRLLTGPGAVPTGVGGNILIQTVAEPTNSSTITTLVLSAGADGTTFVDFEGGPPVGGAPQGNGLGGNILVDIQGGTFAAGSAAEFHANGFGGGASANSGTGTGGTAALVQTGGSVTAPSLTITAHGQGGFDIAQGGIGQGGTASAALTGGSLTTSFMSVAANGDGHPGFDGNDFDPLAPLFAGVGGDGQGGMASLSIGGTASVNADIIEVFAQGLGGDGGSFNSANGTAGNGGAGGNGTGGTAAIQIIGGTLSTTDLIADAAGQGGQGGPIFSSGSGAPIAGTGIGGNGGNGVGGTATLELAQNVTATGNIASRAAASGGNGGFGPAGGDGGSAQGGIAEVVISNFDAGALSVTIDATAAGGSGSAGEDGAGGDGGQATGGTARVVADSAGANVRVIQSNFLTTGHGGAGGNGGSIPGSQPVGGAGGAGGTGTGGTLELIANDGATIALATGPAGTVQLGSSGSGGRGGDGADNNSGPGGTGGSGGNGGAGVGGTVNLLANGGTLTSNGADVAIVVSGTSASGGVGGSGSAANGVDGIAAPDRGGKVMIGSQASPSGAGRVALGATSIAANGFFAGRAELRADGSDITLDSLSVEVLGLANPTNNDTDASPSGIFIKAGDGQVVAGGDMTLTSGGSIGIYAMGAGLVDVAGQMTIGAGDQIDIRHDLTSGIIPTIQVAGDLLASAVTSISGAAGSRLSAGGTMSLGTSAGSVSLDRINANEIILAAGGAARIEHAEAVNDFTASAASFATGLNSIITGGNIDITATGAVDLGNSVAGGIVLVDGQSISFNSISAGDLVSLTATGTAPGAEGISGGSIVAGADINLVANSISASSILSDQSLVAIGTGGSVALDQVDVAGFISVLAGADISGTYVSGGNIDFNAAGNIDASIVAAGGFPDPNDGDRPSAGNGYIVAGGNVTLASSSAAGMLGVSAGGSASLADASAGEDMLVLAGTSATLSNVVAGDNLDVIATGDVVMNGASASDSGIDGFFLAYSPSTGFSIQQGPGSSSLDGSDIDVRSATGSINASNLSAGDDIRLDAATTLNVNGARTLGLGITGGDSSIVTRSGGDSLAGALDAFTDVTSTAGGVFSTSAQIDAARHIGITAQDIRLAPSPGSAMTAGGNVTMTSASAISGGVIDAGGTVTLGAQSAIAIGAARARDIALDARTGIQAASLEATGTTSLTSSAGAVAIDALVSAGDVTASGDTVAISGTGRLVIASLSTDVGGAVVRANELVVTNANIAGLADFASTGAGLTASNLVAGSARLSAGGGDLALGTVTAGGSINASASGSIAASGVVTGTSIALASADIDIQSAARIGTAGVTTQLSITNNDATRPTYVGGSGARSGYHLDASEMSRLFASGFSVIAPDVPSTGSLSVGSAAPPDLIIDSFTMTGGTANSNLGVNGALTLSTSGKARVIGNVTLTGLADTNSLNVTADQALEVILGQGSLRLVNGSAPAGRLHLVSDDVIVATSAAIQDVGRATTTDAIEARLAQNDGVTSDEGALFAGGIDVAVSGGFYVQNSGIGTGFAERRGLTFGPLGLNVSPLSSSTRIIVNGVQLGAGGQVAGLDVVPLLRIGGTPPGPGGPAIDPRSTVNGCVVANPASCGLVTNDIEIFFPVQDVVKEQSDDEEGEQEKQPGIIPASLITIANMDPLTGEPLLDDPVTGAGNEDLWSPPSE